MQRSSDLELVVKDLMSDDFVVYFPAIGRISQLAPSASLLKSSGAGRRLRSLAELATTPMPAKVQIRAIFDSLVALVRRERRSKRVASDMLGHSGFSVCPCKRLALQVSAKDRVVAAFESASLLRGV